MPPAPDFLCNTSSGVIGIEHTDFQTDRKPGADSPAAAQERLKDRLLATAAAAYNGPPVDVLALFRSPLVVRRSDLPKLGASLAAFVTQNLPGHGSETRLESFRDLPPTLKDNFSILWINRQEWLKASQWQVSRAGSVAHVETMFRVIQDVLDHKEVKMPNYRSTCDHVWLLIVAEGFEPHTYLVIDECLPDHLLRSSFDRAFLLSIMLKRVDELNLIPL